MRILARHKLQQQFVQIKPAQQRCALRQRHATAPVGGEQRFELARARPRHEQRLERIQQSAQLRTRTLRAARDHRHAAVRRGEHLDDEARLAVRIRMENERRLIIAAVAELPRHLADGSGTYLKILS